VGLLSSYVSCGRDTSAPTYSGEIGIFNQTVTITKLRGTNQIKRIDQVKPEAIHLL
jgi:hypothetical protein